MTEPGTGDAFLKVNGAGENLVWSAADFENFLQPRPDLKPMMESELEAVVRVLVQNRWPFRIHATYDESIQRFLNVFERIDRDIPFDGLRWWFDHAETISAPSLDRVAALSGGIAIQHRAAYQGEYFIRRFGKQAAQAIPPVKAMLKRGIPLGAGTDGTRVASYHPWTCLWWLVSGQTVGGTEITAPVDRLTREEALRLYTQGSAWFSGEQSKKGTLTANQFADLAVLDRDYFSVPEDEIRDIESVLTVLNGQAVYAAEEFSAECPPLPPVSPDWSPVGKWGGYDNSTVDSCGQPHSGGHAHAHVMGPEGRLWAVACDCAVF